jgi:hypothetical protein
VEGVLGLPPHIIFFFIFFISPQIGRVVHAGPGTAALQIEQRRVDYGALEQRVADALGELERGLHAQVLARLDIDVPAIRVWGDEYRRIGRFERTGCRARRCPPPSPELRQQQRPPGSRSSPT